MSHWYDEIWGRMGALRIYTPEEIQEPGMLEWLIMEMGVHQDKLAAMPKDFGGYCRGIRTAQLPIQMGPYLRYVAQKDVTRYLELGVGNGGSLLMTVEALGVVKFRPTYLGVDHLLHDEVREYHRNNQDGRLIQGEIEATKNQWGRQYYDLVLIDADPTKAQQYFSLVAGLTKMVAVSGILDPQVAPQWEGMRKTPGWRSTEWIEQYPDAVSPEVKTSSGIGLLERG